MAEISAPHVFYVSKTGNDADGKTWTTAYKKIQTAIDDPDFKAGYTINVGPGEFKEEVTTTVPVHLVGTSRWGSRLDFSSTSKDKNTLKLVPGSSVKNFTVTHTSGASFNGNAIVCEGDSQEPVILDDVLVESPGNRAVIVQHRGLCILRNSVILGDEYGVIFRKLIMTDAYIDLEFGMYEDSATAAIFLGETSNVPKEYADANAIVGGCFVNGLRGTVGFDDNDGHGIQVISQGYLRVDRSTILSRTIDTHDSIGVLSIGASEDDPDGSFTIDVSRSRVNGIHTGAGSGKEFDVDSGEGGTITLAGTTYRPNKTLVILDGRILNMENA